MADDSVLTHLLASIHQTIERLSKSVRAQSEEIEALRKALKEKGGTSESLRRELEEIAGRLAEMDRGLADEGNGSGSPDRAPPAGR